jgi:hypothetical protein
MAQEKLLPVQDARIVYEPAVAAAVKVYVAVAVVEDVATRLTVAGVMEPLVPAENITVPTGVALLAVTMPVTVATAVIEPLGATVDGVSTTLTGASLKVTVTVTGLDAGLAA